MQTRFSTRLADLKASPIRDILEVVEKPGIVSFAGGLPCAESFPHLGQMEIPRHVLQYGATEGESALREEIASELCGRGLNCTSDQVLVLNGSQQGIDLVAKLFIDAGSQVAVESPTYLAALQVFRYFVRLKQAADLHSNRVSQWLILQQLRDSCRAARLDKVRDDYRAKRDHFNNCLERTFAHLATWQVPPGGLFFWLRLKSDSPIGTRALLATAIERSVVFMPGEPFFAQENAGLGTLRLNFSHASYADVERGLNVLAKLVQEQMIAMR